MPDRRVSKLTGACQHMDIPTDMRNSIQDRGFCGGPDITLEYASRVVAISFKPCLRVGGARPACRRNLFAAYAPRWCATSHGMSGPVLSLSDFIQMMLFLHLLIPAVGVCGPLA